MGNQGGYVPQRPIKAVAWSLLKELKGKVTGIRMANQLPVKLCPIGCGAIRIDKLTAR